MEERPDLWDGTGSMVEHLGSEGEVQLEGAGQLEIEKDNEGPEVPEGPGQVHFVVAYHPSDWQGVHTQAIELELTSLDDKAAEILRWTPSSGERRPFARYSLSGLLSKPQDKVASQT